MTKYQVTIEAVIRKTYEVEAEDMQKAQEMANEMFTVEPDGDEYYDQQVIGLRRQAWTAEAVHSTCATSSDP